jgi:UDP-arabinose 4-epimerase
MTNRTVFVTGGAGYIGSHACKSLAAAGFLPVTYDSLVHGHRSAVKWGPLEVGDTRDAAKLEQVMRRYRPCAVLHFAAFAYVGESVVNPAKYYDNNVGGTLSLLRAMRVCAVDMMVFSSTCATYGVPEQQPITESALQHPINPYGASKLMVERVLRDYGVAYGLRTATLRYFNACGADPDAEIGEDHEPETHLIPRGLMAACAAIPKLDVFGTDYPTPDGTCIRDYIHVSDLAAGHVQALNYLLDGRETIALNLGTGQGVSVREIVASLERVTGKAVPVHFGPRRAGDPAVLLADPSRARRVLGFSPRFSGIDQMIATAWRWHRRDRANKPEKVACEES